MPNGDHYEGEFKHNKPNGNGTWTLSNGNEVRGTYHQKFIELGAINEDESPLDPSNNLRVKLTWTTKQVVKPHKFPRRFSDQVRAQLRFNFNRHDKDGTGQIDVFEMQQALNGMGYDADEEMSRRVIKSLDYDENGLMSFNEFVEFVYRLIGTRKQLKDFHN